MKRILAAVVAAMMLLCAMPVGVGARANAPTLGAMVMLRFDDELTDIVGNNQAIRGIAALQLDEDGTVVNTRYMCDLGDCGCSDVSGFFPVEEVFADELVADKRPAGLQDGDMVLMIHAAYAGVYYNDEGIVFDGVDAKALFVMPSEDQPASLDDGGNGSAIELASVTFGVNGSNSLEMLVAYGSDLTFVGDNEENDTLMIENTTSSLYEMVDEHPMAYILDDIIFGELNIMPEYIGAVSLLASDLTLTGMTMDVTGYGNIAPEIRMPLRMAQPQDELPGYAYGLLCYASNITVKGTLKVKSADAEGESVAIRTPYLYSDNGVHFTLTVDGGTVNAVGGKAQYSNGIYAVDGDITVEKDSELHASSAEGEYFSEGIFLAGGTLTVKPGAVLTAIGGERDEPMDGNYDYCSAGIDLSECELTIKDGADVLAKGYDMAIIGRDSELDAADVSGEMSEDYDYEDTNTVEPLADKLATCFVAQSEGDSPELITYKYLHIYTPDEEDDPAGFNLFLLMLMMAQIDVEITGEGTVTHDGNTRMAYFNKPRTYTITPAEGWKISDVLHEGESLGAVDTVEIIPTVRKSLLEVIFTEIASDDAE